MNPKPVVLVLALLAELGTLSNAAEPRDMKPVAQEPTPLIRDIKTGYLMNYNFLSPRPYCWTKDDSLLSGWEVDKSGGSWACHPTCHYPDGFAFHSDWFKLIDTSNVAAVTIKHKIARQSTGDVTLEYRFKMPKKMDGAAWQLRDLAQAGVSIVTADGNLCYETSAGKPVVLQPYEADHDYGVKVVANLTTKTAEVYVDGALKAKAAPFCRPIATIDYVLVKTGDTAVGELFLAPVNVYKGYVVNETFVTSGAGRIPDDWLVVANAGTATVETYECSTKPDIFSLKLCGDNRDGAAVPYVAVIKGFPPLGGKTVFQCRFLLPEKATTFRAGLYSWEGEGLMIAASKEDLCLAGHKVPLVHKYRTNLWYMLKAITDPVAKKADIYINGKLAAENVAINPRIKNFRGVIFAAQRGTIAWVDDVQVYPWEDYPADYVPPPKPCPAGPYLLGVQSCNLWREGNSYAGWDYVYPCRDKRKPYLGWYDEGHPEVADWEIKWQVEHGITFEQHCWYRPNNAINHPIKDGVLDQSIVKGLFNARYSHLKKFTIMCTDEGACETNADDFRNNIIPYWIEYFFKDPRYLTVDGKPVLSIYHFGNWLRMFGGQAGGRAAIQVLREEVAKAGLPGIIVLMEERSGDENVLRTMKSLGVDYCYSYTWFTPSAEVERSRMINSRDHCAAVGFNVLPSISMGWDREAWGVHDGGWLSFADYKKLAEWTRDQYMPSLPAGSLGRRMVLLANWNEFGEGHFMLPNASGRFGYLDALRDVFTSGGPHQDVKPTEQQTRRFNVLFPRD